MKRESRRACRAGLDCKQLQCRFLHPKWNCSVCTYLNVWEEPDCLMCAHPRLKAPVYIHVPNPLPPPSSSSASSASSSSCSSSSSSSSNSAYFAHQHGNSNHSNNVQPSLPNPLHQQFSHPSYHHPQHQPGQSYYPLPPNLQHQQPPPPYYHHHPHHIPEPDLQGDWSKKKPPSCEDGLPPCPNGQNCSIRTSAHMNMFSHLFINNDQDTKLRSTNNNFRSKRGGKQHHNSSNSNSNGNNNTQPLTNSIQPFRSIADISSSSSASSTSSSSSEILMDVSSLDTSSLLSSRLSDSILNLDDQQLPSSLSRHVSIPDNIRACSEEAMDPVLLGRSASAYTITSHNNNNNNSSLPSPILVSPPRSHTEPTRSASPPPPSPFFSSSQSLLPDTPSSKPPSPLNADDLIKKTSSSHNSNNGGSSGSNSNSSSRGTTPVSQKRPVFIKALSLPASRQTEDPEITQEKFWHAIEAGDIEAVGVFLTTSEHFIKSMDSQGNTPLIRACTLGHIQLASFLLDQNASVNESNKDGFTPLLAAALNGQEATVQLLLDLGTDIEQRCKASYTALHCACFRGHLATVKLLIERDANMEHIAKGGMTPLLFSGFAKHAYTVQYLVSQGADVKVCDAQGRNLLDFSMSNSDIKFAIETGMQLWQHRKDEEHRKKLEETKKKQRSPKESNSNSNNSQNNNNNNNNSSSGNNSKKGGDKNSNNNNNNNKKSIVEIKKSLSMDISSWTETEVRRWLDEQNFSHYASSFCENMINGEMLLSLTESELEQDLKIENRLHRRRLLLEIGKLAVKAQANQNLGKLRGEPEENPSSSLPLSSSIHEQQHQQQQQMQQQQQQPLSSSTQSTKLSSWQQKPMTQEYGTRLLSSPHPAGIAVFQASDFSDVHLLAKGEFSMAFAAILTTRRRKKRNNSSEGEEGGGGERERGRRAEGGRGGEEEEEVCQEKVVIKFPNAKPGPNEWNELNTFLHLPKHPNILPFLGICKDFQHQERKSSFCIITKRQAGSIKDVLINSKHSEFDLPVNKLRVIHDFVSGLAHLHAHNVIHRDIASRNILISYSGNAVVCDFGLSRSIDPQPDEDMMDAVNFKETYYRVDQQHLLPVRWMAPESLNSGKFSRKSDVWMCGVTIWQVLTSCDQKPYESLATANQVIITVCTGQGGPLLLESLTHLPACLHALRDLVSQCLQVRPSDRPTMAQCCHLIKSLQDSISSNANNLPASLSDLTGWPKGGKAKPFLKVVEQPSSLSAPPSTSTSVRKTEKVNEKPNNNGVVASVSAVKSQSLIAQQNGRKHERTIAQITKNEKNIPGTETGKSKQQHGNSTHVARSGKATHANKPTTTAVINKASSQPPPKKVADYDEVLVPEFESEDEEPG